MVRNSEAVPSISWLVPMLSIEYTIVMIGETKNFMIIVRYIGAFWRPEGI